MRQGQSEAYRSIAQTHTVYVCNSALTASSVRSALAGPRDQLGHPDTAYHESASHSLKHGLADALKYILEWAAVVCTAMPVQFVQSLADVWKKTDLNSYTEGLKLTFLEQGMTKIVNLPFIPVLCDSVG